MNGFTYSQAMELPCDFEELCAVAEVPVGTAFALVPLKLISVIENLRQNARMPRRIEVICRYDRDDACGNGKNKNGDPLTGDELRLVLAQKIRIAEQDLEGLKQRLAAIDAPPLPEGVGESEAFIN